MAQFTIEQALKTALQHYHAGRLQQAEMHCRQILAQQPNHAEALHLLGVIANQAGQHDVAVALIRHAIALQPNWPEAHYHLGNALSGQGRQDEAVAAWRQAITLKANYPEAQHRLGDALRDKGQMSEAMAAYRRAVELAPGFAGPWNSWGGALCCLGRFDEAAECFRRALELDSTFSTAYQNLAELRLQGAPPADIDRMRRLWADESLPVDDRVRIGFALGKVLDDSDRFDEAFSAYAKANSLFRVSRAAIGEQFDLPSLAREVDQLIRESTRARFEEIGHAGSRSEAPVFIVGMPRSGTSLVEQIAASHPQVFGAGELRDIGLLGEALGGWGQAGAARHLDAVAAARLADAHVERLAAMSGGAARVIDKMLGNTFALALIAALFPRSRIIFCHRDSRDTCLSCYFHLFQGNLLFARDQTDCAKQWVQTHRLMKHWRAVLPVRMLDIQYEQVVADLEGQSRRLVDFLGLAWDPACLDFHKAQRVVLTSSNWQVRQPLYGRSVGRWRHYQRHLGPMLEVLGRDGAGGRQ